MHHFGKRAKDQEGWARTPRGRGFRTRKSVEEANLWMTRFVQREKHSMTFRLVIMMCFSMGWRTWLKNKIFRVCLRWIRRWFNCGVTHQKYWANHLIFTVFYFHSNLKDIVSWEYERRAVSTYVIEKNLSLSLWSTILWSTLIRKRKFPSPRNRLGV